MKRSHALEALDGAFDAHLSKIFDVYSVLVAIEDGGADHTFRIAWTALLKAHGQAEQLIISTMPDDKTVPGH